MVPDGDGLFALLSPELFYPKHFLKFPVRLLRVSFSIPIASPILFIHSTAGPLPYRKGKGLILQKLNVGRTQRVIALS